MTQSIKKFSNLFAIMLLTSFLAACATAPTETSSSSTSQSDVVGGIYVGTDTVEMLAIDVPDRVFFAYDSYSLAASAQATLNKQAKWLKANPSVAIAIEGHADERGTREYNLALGDRRASSVKDYLMSQGISSNRISTISYGKERPVKSGSNDTAWAQNRRSVSVRTN
ncbi:peptidoglycan-associated lipoprotein Pal [Pelagibacteraceae bacterium]|nr:peptidoglycan-associated lipoprotein Pal [Pelagibacteraceae bacterium]